MPRTKPKTETPQTTAQQLASLVKSCRDIMRKDRGLNGDLDRLPMLTWIMFLKFLDDMERVREEEAKLAGKKFRRAIEPPYRWRDWAADPGGIKGDELTAFINHDEAVRPDGKRGRGLFAYLKGLESANGDRRDVIATVFKGLTNRMASGYLLRAVLNKVNEIHFTSRDEIYTLGLLYESMLKEMRDAAGDSGEFYTPRSLVKFIVSVVDPRLGETVLDPAAGTGGFLVESFEHLKKQCKKKEDFEQLQRGTLHGIEPKSLPYLLCQMNLLLHGLEYPQVGSHNALDKPLREIGDKERVDVVMTNPPFGGEEERGILGNFPEDKQTAETALLFLQLIMRKLRRPGGGMKPGRCGMVVSDGFLSTKGVAARIKEELLSEFNLHTIVRLPRGVFVPYTPIATNLLFLDRSGPSKDIWFYEIPGPTDRQTYSKTKPFRYEEFGACLSWWNNRRETDQAWSVSRKEVAERNYDLDFQNPSVKHHNITSKPEDLVTSVLAGSKAAVRSAEKLAATYQANVAVKNSSKTLIPLSRFLRLRKTFITIDDSQEYKLLTVQLHARGITPRGQKLGGEIKTKKQQIVRSGDLVVAEIDAKVGGFGLVPPEGEGAIVSSHYFVYEIDNSVVDSKYFEWFLKSGLPELLVQPYVKGSTNYAAIRQQHFPLLAMQAPEDVAEQRRIVSELGTLQAEVEALKRLQAETAAELDALLPSILDRAFRGENFKRT